jgi:hypothetical protein
MLAIIFVGALDMSYALCTFWPANQMPVSVLCVMMQLFIPLNTFMNIFGCGREEYKRHLLTSCVIIVGVVLSLCSIYKSFHIVT